MTTAEQGPTHEQTPDRPQLKNILERNGVEVLRMTEGKLTRPTLSTDPDGHFGKKNHIAISRAQQEALGLPDELSKYVVSTVAPDGSLQFSILSALAPDEDWQIGDRSGEGFFSRAGKGLHRADGIPDEVTARSIAAEYPLTSDSIAAPFFDNGNPGQTHEFAILDPEKLVGKIVETHLPVKDLTNGYPQHMLEKWAQENTEQRSIVIVPNAVARLLGIPLTSRTNQPHQFGGTIAQGTTCMINFEGKRIQAFVGGALDSVGLSIDASHLLGIDAGDMLTLSIVIGKKELALTRKSS